MRRLGYQGRLEETRFRILWQCIQRYAYFDSSFPVRILCKVGTYLGIEVAIKEVLPSTEYDVAKYFEREWRLMKCVTLYFFPAVHFLL